MTIPSGFGNFANGLVFIRDRSDEPIPFLFKNQRSPLYWETFFEIWINKKN